MAEYYKNDEVLKVEGYEIYFTRFSDSILLDHFKESLSEMKKILEEFYIDEHLITKGGGGKSKITQNLALLFNNNGWKKEIIESEHHLTRIMSPKSKARTLVSGTHEVDHYKSYDHGDIGLEIEWNNKDPFFDRDLENFRKLHQLGAISLGVIVTRGASLQLELVKVYERFLSEIEPLDYGSLTNKLSLSDKAKSTCKELLCLPRERAVEEIAKAISGSKYGKATTHMDKLLLRIDRGVGNPCPMLLIGIGRERIITNEEVQTRQKISDTLF